jgi:hypothetical protein
MADAYANVGSIVRMHRTFPLHTGVRSVLVLPSGYTIHVLEDDPIPAGVYFMRPDFTGTHRHWVIECVLGSRIAVPAVINDQQVEVSPARSAVEVHSGNTLIHSDACLLPGLRTTLTGVADSKPALTRMRDELKRDEQVPPVHVLDIR